MPLRFTFIVIDGRRFPGNPNTPPLPPDPPRWVEQDLTAIKGYDANRSELNSSRSAKPATSKAYLSFLQDTPDLNIYEEAEVWAGWRDTDTGQWYDFPAVPDRLYGGYILKIDKSYTEGSEKKMELTLIDYMHDPTTMAVDSWPNPESDPSPAGYPPGYSVRDWLVGRRSEGKPWDGLLVQNFTGDVRLDGVDEVFAGIIFNTDTLPGIIELGTNIDKGINGRYGTILLADAITNLADAAAWTWSRNYSGGGQDLRVAWWMEAAIGSDGTKLVPRFRFANQADVGHADWTIATDANEAAGEFSPIRDAFHARDATGRQDRVYMRGIGFDQTLPGAPLPVQAIVTDTAHQRQYPTRYAKNPGRTTQIIFETRLHTRELALKLGTRFEQLLWGARGAITQDVLAPIAQGEFVRYRNPNEALDQVYPCTESTVVAGTAGSPHYRVTIGFNPPTLEDLIRGGLVDAMLNAEDLAFKTGQLPQRTLTGVPAQIPPELTPMHPARNKIQAMFNDTPGVKVQGTTRARVADPGTVPLPVSGSFEASGPDDKVRSWTDQNGVHHPIGVRMSFTASAVPKFFVAEADYVRMGVALHEKSGLGTETLTFTVNGVLTAAPFPGNKSDRIGVTAAGVDAGTPFVVIVREQDPT